MVNVRPEDSESDESSDHTSEEEVLMPRRVGQIQTADEIPLNSSEYVSSRPSLPPSLAPDEPLSESTGTSLAIPSSSQPLETATHGVGQSDPPVDTPSTNRGPAHMTRVGSIQYLCYLLRQHESRAPFPRRGNPAATFKHLSVTHSGFNRLMPFQNVSLNANTLSPSESDSSETGDECTDQGIEEGVELQEGDLDGSQDGDGSIREKSDNNDEKEHTAAEITDTDDDIFDISNTPPGDDHEPAQSDLDLRSLAICSDDPPKLDELEEDQARNLLDEDEVRDTWEDWCEERNEFPNPISSACHSRDVLIVSPATKRRNAKKERRRRAREAKVMAVHTVKKFIVPTHKIGRIVGRGGRTIRDLERKTQTKIQIQNRSSDGAVTHITIAGTEEAIAAADEEICIIIRNYKLVEIGNVQPLTGKNENKQKDSDPRN